MKLFSTPTSLLLAGLLSAPAGALAQAPTPPQAPSATMAPQNANALPVAPVLPAIPAQPLAAPAQAADAAAEAAASEPRTLARAISLPAQQKMPESFGAPMQLVIGGASSLNVHGFHQQLRNAKASSISLDFEPWVGFFAARHLLIGGQIPVGFAKGGGLWYANVAAGPFIAWHIPVGTHFALLPRAGAAYQFGRTRASGNQAVQYGDTHTVFVNARIDAVIHLTHHLSVAVGPYATWSVLNRYNGQKQAWMTYYGLQASVLGWI